MKIIGITGPIGSGKSYVASIIEKRGFVRVDTDEVYHELVSDRTYCTEKIGELFGQNVIFPDGSLDRKALSNIVFSDKEKLEKLNEIAHACVKKRTMEIFSELKKNGKEIVLVEVPLMFESGFDKLCDKVICVIADKEIRKQRIMQRNGMSEADAVRRMDSQSSDSYYIENSDYTVINNGTEDLNDRIDNILSQILS